MMRVLTDNEIHELLEKECYGHLACCVDRQQPYLVPITYVYREHALYSFSFEGKKIDMMRVNPHACVQIERLREPDRWRSAIVWGTFEELTGDDRSSAFALILERLWLESAREHPLFLPFRNSAKTLEAAKKEENVVLYRINITELTGRLELYE